MILTKENAGRMYERKKFFRLIFNGIEKDEYIRIFQSKEDYSQVTFFNGIDELNDYCESKRFNANTYFNLATTDGVGGATENLKYRYCLAWDFDKKIDSNLDSKELMFRFKELGLWYHALIDSGNGYHVYMVIDKTEDLDKVDEVTKSIGLKLKADTDAMLKTQILRVPFGYNYKYEKLKQVNIVKMWEKNVKPYSIEKLYKSYCGKTDRTIQYALKKSNFPPCVSNILKGVIDGNRNFAIKRLISFLKVYQYSKSESWNVVKEWNYKNSPPINDDELERQFNYIWEKNYNCFGCITNDIDAQAKIKTYCNINLCKSESKNNILFIEGETIQMEYKICDKIKLHKKSFQIKGNHLLLIGILKNYPEGLNTSEILAKLTYKEKCCMSNKTLGNILNELTENKYLTRIIGNKRKKEKDFYKFNQIDCKEMDKFNLSYFAILGVVEKKISAEDFKIYCFMRYRLSKGLNVTQEKIGDELNITQQAVSSHINSLVKEHYLEIKKVDYSNGLPTNVYKLNA